MKKKNKIIQINGNRILSCLLAIALVMAGVAVAEYKKEQRELIMPGKTLQYSLVDHQQVDYRNLVPDSTMSKVPLFYQVLLNSTTIRLLSTRNSNLYKQVEVMKRSPICVPMIIYFDNVECLNLRINPKYKKECTDIMQKMWLTNNDLVCYEKIQS